LWRARGIDTDIGMYAAERRDDRLVIELAGPLG
jgi:hypothetical protein